MVIVGIREEFSSQAVRPVPFQVGSAGRVWDREMD